MHRHIVYIVNPISGTRAKKDLKELIHSKTGERNISFDILPSVANADYSFLHHIIKEKKTTDIVIAGGDGTVSQCIGALMKFEVNFGILPCGSGNGLAHAAKIPSQPGKALDIIFNGKAELTDGFYINNKFACMLCGLGFDAKVAHDFAKQPKRGLSTYVKQVVKNFFSAKSYSFDIALPDHSFKTEAFFISIANANQFGNNFKIAPQASLNDGLLDIVIVADQMKLSLLFQTLKQVSGINKLQTGTIKTENKSIVYFQTDQLSIVNKSFAPLHIDGDPAETSKKFELKINKNCFRLLRP